MLTILQVPVFAGSHVRALEIARKDFLEILPTIDHVPWQVVELVPRQVG
jgi:hypothetical protein